MKKLSFTLIASVLIAINCSSKKQTSNNSEPLAKSILETPLNDTITLASGLRYKVLKEGVGKKPKPTSKIKVHYEGKLDDGTVFDSSIKRGKPLEFRLNQVIKGWQEGLLLMKEGAIYELYIPPNLGYGARQAGKIPPFSTLNFRVELLEIL